MTGQRSWAETEAKLDLSEVRYCAAEGKAGLVWLQREEQSVSLTSLGFVFHDEGNNYVIK